MYDSIIEKINILVKNKNILKNICEKYKKYRTLKLTITQSIKYCKDGDYKNKILNLIKNPNKQLHLDLRYCQNIRDVSMLGGLPTPYLDKDLTSQGKQMLASGNAASRSESGETRVGNKSRSKNNV